MSSTPNPEQAITVAKLMAERSLTYEEAWSLVRLAEFNRGQDELNDGQDDDPGDLPSTISPSVGQEDILFRDGMDGSYNAPLSGTPTSSQIGSIKYESEGGTVAHRGVLDEEEWIDPEVMADEIELRLLHSVEDVQYLFSRPKLSAEDRKAKEYVEDCLLAVRDAGGTLTQLAVAFGWKIKANRTCKQMDQALARARSRRT